MPKKLDLTGQRFGRLVAIESGPKQGRRTTWKCKCDCGNEVVIITDSLRSGRTQSCGCLRSELRADKNRQQVKNLIGQRFGKLTVIQQAESYRDHSAWLCECDCGNTKVVNSMELKRGETLSCGCLRSSFGELKIEEILQENNLLYKKEVIFQDLLSENQVPLRFDFGVYNTPTELAYLIEYDGEQHYLTKTEAIWKDSLSQRQQRDAIKTEYCLQHKIPLVRIPYWEKNNLSLELITSGKYLIQ